MFPSTFCLFHSHFLFNLLELLQAEENKLAEDAKAAMADRIKPLPSTDGLDDEQLKQLC